MDGKFAVRDQLSALFQQPVPLPRRVEPNSIKRAVLRRHGPKNPIEQEETDAEVGFHAAFAIHPVVVNVVQPPRRAKPRVQQRIPGHPELREVHAIV